MADDQIAVRSVTGVDMTLTLAGPGSRSYAFVIDWHIRLLLTVAWLLATTTLFGWSSKTFQTHFFTTLLPAAVIYFFYHPVLEVLMRGRTPGKRMAGVRLLNRNGGLPTTIALIIRNLFRLVDSLPVFYIVGLASCLATRHQVRIGDMAGGTLLVRDQSETESTLVRLGEHASSSQLPLEALELVDQLLERWNSLESPHRVQIAKSLLARITPRAEGAEPSSEAELRDRLQACRQAPQATALTDRSEIRNWVLARAAGWRSVVERITMLRSEGRGTVEQALNAVESYRSLARDVATARRIAPQSRTTAALGSLYGQMHALINRKPMGNARVLMSLLNTSVPVAARAVRGKILMMGSIMAVSALAGWWLIASYPELISLIAGPTMIEEVEHGHLWTEGLLNVTPSSVLSIGILANNITVSIMAFSAGIFFGLATFYLVAFNGLMLGAIFAFVHQHKLAAGLFSFIAAHGPVELSVICIAGACGVALGESIIRPQLASRRDSFEACAHQLAPLLLLCALLLIGCGFIEGFVSPNPIFPMASRAVIGVAYFAIMVIFLSGGLFQPLVKHAAAD